jgi:hypothetical protein
MLTATQAAELTCERVEEALGKSPAFRKVDHGFYVVRQGSAYVLIRVLAYRPEGALVRLVAQLAKGVEMSPDLALRLLRLNAKLRFGSFGWVRDGSCVTLQHTLMAGPGLEPEELSAIVRDLALVADEYDDVVVNEAGGKTMQALLEERELSALQAALAGEPFDSGSHPTKK